MSKENKIMYALWIDHATYSDINSGGWKSKDKVEDDIKDEKHYMCETIGYLVAENDKFIALAATKTLDDEADYNAIQYILKSDIKKKKLIKL